MKHGMILNPFSEADVLGHDGDSLAVDGTFVGVLEQVNLGS